MLLETWHDKLQFNHVSIRIRVEVLLLYTGCLKNCAAAGIRTQHRSKPGHAALSSPGLGPESWVRIPLAVVEFLLILELALIELRPICKLTKSKVIDDVRVANYVDCIKI